MKLTFYGHACLLLETQGQRMLFDPFISPNPLAASIDVDAIETDFILVSHGHQDHLADVESIAKRTGCKVIANYEVACWFGEKGLETMPMNYGGTWHTPAGAVKMVNAIHSSVLPDGTHGGNPGGFVITNDEDCVYYAGDTALTMDMKLIGMQHKVDVAILPIGDVFTMGVDDAIIASDFVGCDTVVGVHFNTFPPIEVDTEAAKAKFAEAGKTLIILEIGSSWER